MSILSRRLARARAGAPWPGRVRPAPSAGLAVHAVGYLWTYSGYAVAFRAILAELERRGVAVSAASLDRRVSRLELSPAEADQVRRWHARPPGAAAIALSFLPPDKLFRHRTPLLRGARHVAITEFEAGALPPAMVQRLNEQDEIWNPSAWGVRTFRAAGVFKPVHHLPHGVDLDLFRPPVRRSVDPGALRFLTVAMFQPRKGYDILFRAAALALRPTDTLVVVARRARPRHVRALAEACRAEVGAPGLPRLELHTQALSNDHLAELYRTAHALVLPTRGEGDGLPVREAMAAALPVVAPAAGPLEDLVTDRIAFPVAALPRGGLPHGYGVSPAYPPDLPFFEPDLASLVGHLRAIVEDPAAAADRGARARQAMEADRSWSHVATTMMERLAHACSP